MVLLHLQYDLVMRRDGGSIKMGVEKTRYLLIPKDMLTELKNFGIDLDHKKPEFEAELAYDVESKKIKIIYSFNFDETLIDIFLKNNVHTAVTEQTVKAPQSLEPMVAK